MVLSSGNVSSYLTVGELLQEKAEDWQLSVIAGEGGKDRAIETHELCRPGLLFAGYENHFASKRIQIIGMAEWSFLDHLPSDAKNEAIVRLFKYRTIPAIIIAKRLPPPDGMKELADRNNIPLISSGLPTTLLEHFLSDYLWRKLSRYVLVHADLLSVYGVGVLIGGKSGVGKSETALDLIYRGHALVADDVVKIIQYPPGRLLGCSAAPVEASELRDILHVRGIGLVNVFNLFGIKAIRTESPIDVYVELVRGDSLNGDSRRGTVRPEGLETGQEEILGVRIPRYDIIVEPKKNTATLIEVIALRHIMGLEGKDTLQEVERIFEKNAGASGGND